jgi:hypothetical protein
VGHHLDIRQDGGAAGGVAGHHLEKGVGERRDGPVDHEGQGTQGGNDDPAESGDENAVFDAQVVVFSESATTAAAPTKGSPPRKPKSTKIPFTVYQCTDRGAHHGNARDQEQGAEDMKNGKRCMLRCQ